MTKSIPKTKAKVKENNNPWWTHELQQQRKKLNTLYKNKIKQKHSYSTEQYNAYRNQYKKNIEKARKGSWEDYKEKIGSVEEMNRFRKVIEKRLNIQLGALERPDGTITDPGKDTLMHLMETHFNQASELKDTQYDESISITRQEIADWKPDWISIGKVNLAIHQFLNKKSPGPDGLKPIVLKNLPDSSQKFLMILYKMCILLEFTPTKWKGSRVVFIPKPGKSNYKIAKAWRPISLTNYILKALERLCGWHMDEVLKTNPLHSNQHGFRTDRNTETAISSAANYIEKYIYNGEHVVGVFLDIQAAFDTISPNAVKEALLKRGGDKKMVLWYHSCITHRNLHIEINGEKITLTTSVGFPQGGVCSAKFWVIAYDEAVYILNEHGIFGQVFADDSVGLKGGKNLHHSMSRLQKSVTKLEEWGTDRGLKFNASKTVVVIFTKSRLKSSQLPNKLKVGGIDVDFSDTAKYLGVTLDSKLNWGIHFNNQLTKCKQYLFTLKKSVCKAWGPKPVFIRWVYIAIVRPKLCYGSIAWGHTTRLDTRKGALNKLNRLAATMITPVRRSTPVKTMEILYDLVPLHLFIQYEAIASLSRNRYCMKLDWPGQNPTRKTYIGHLKYWWYKLEEVNIEIDENDRIQDLIWHKLYKIDTDSFLYHNLPIQTQINVYTDGSKTERHTGSGYVIIRGGNTIKEGSRRLPDEATVFQAELMAIQIAMLDLAGILNDNDSYVKIFSDSRAAIQALNSSTVTSQLVKNTIAALNLVGSKVSRLEIAWIKAHVGHWGNERADQLARDSINLKHNVHGILLPYSHFKMELWDVTYKLWKDEWSTNSTCRLSKNFLPYPDKNKSKEILKLSRSQMRRLLELITGQNNLNYVQSKIYPGLVSELCRFCEEEEMFAHLINECPCFNTYRRETLNNKPIIRTLEWKPKTLLDFSYIPAIEEALRFGDDPID